MSRITHLDFIGTRARLQRLTDAKILNGWIANLNDQIVDITATTVAQLHKGDQFQIEGFGNRISVSFTAVLGEVEYLEAGPKLQVDGEVKPSLRNPMKVSLKMRIATQIRYGSSSEAVRVKVDDLPAQVVYKGARLDAVVIDVGKNGVGLVVPAAMEPGQTVQLMVGTSTGPIKTTADVRYCREEPDRPNYFRVGLMFLDLGRVERPKWEQFVKKGA